MAMLNEKIQQQVRQVLAGMEEPVKMVMFTQGEGGIIECSMCSETRQLVEEVAELSDKLSAEVLDFVRDEDEARKYGVDKIPAIVMLRDGSQPTDYGIRLYGIPSGYEFTSLIEDILLASKGRAEVSQKTMQALEDLQEPVHIQVFVTPT